MSRELPFFSFGLVGREKYEARLALVQDVDHLVGEALLLGVVQDEGLVEVPDLEGRRLAVKGHASTLARICTPSSWLAVRS
ncbi:hypothetical protein [Leifsonia sp. P73]|uniref:hypothetical protein n=1 Tax=Leifsonia sp. P73 TaxID=3423959 RepID=UPI003DA511C0